MIRRFALITLFIATVPICIADDSPSDHRSDTADPAASKPLIAHWTFDDDASSKTIANATSHQLDVALSQPLPRPPGVHGRAIHLQGRPILPVPIGAQLADAEQITFSAWARPNELSSYREIFRQECAERLLFSFQNDGHVLSLGLNIGGRYIECDARINPVHVSGGDWHHLAATFDGRTMRVYLDGHEIGALEHPGPLVINSKVSGFIGSSGGRGEFFQGDLDDLRIYATALTPGEIKSLNDIGRLQIEQRLKRVTAQVDRYYTRQATFASTLASVRRLAIEKQIAIDDDQASLLRARLRADFPRESSDFASWTESDVVEYLRDPTSRVQIRILRRMLDLLLEYRPLTASQQAKLTEQHRQSWAEADELARRFESLRDQGDAAKFSPLWIELILEAGSRVTFRPRVHEAVAPYVRPETPETRDLSSQDAIDALRRDWLHQAGGKPTRERVEQEVTWTRQLAARIEAGFPQQVDLSTELKELDQAAARLGKEDASVEQVYFRVRTVKRAIMFKNPVIDFDQVLFVDSPYPRGKEWRHETRHRLGYMAVPGGRLLVLKGLSPAGHLTQLAPQSPLHGSFWRPDLSWDARRVLFCFKPHNEKSFHLYEVDIDGGNLKQLTDGPYDDLDPIYLPNGKHILFSTTRGHTYVRCMPPTNAFVLARSDTSGRNIYLVSRNNEPDYLPSVMNDGRVLYTRWEYTDKPLWRAQGLWTMNPDGTDVNTLWGNQSVWPDLLKDARAIPGSRRVMFTGSAHHNWFSGSIGIIDPTRGFNFPAGLTKVTADVPWPESGNGPVDPVESDRYHASGIYSGYYSPFPLSESDFLVSACRNGKFVLYLMDTDGNRELIYEGTHQILHAIPVRRRGRPPVITDRVAWPGPDERESPQDGFLFSSNVYEGMPPQVQGKVRYLRVLNIDHKTYTYWYKRPYASTGPVVSIVQSEGVKRIIGTVPVERDGSVSLQVPAGIPLHFQLLDEKYRALQTMRSFTGVMPGERRGCVGCHESHSRAPTYASTALAFQREPSRITPPPWKDRTVSFDRYVQPLLDRYCGDCHQGNGEARAALDLTRRPGWSLFDEPYVTLTGKPTWGQPYQRPAKPAPGWGSAGTLMVEAFDQRDPRAYQTPAPMTSLSYRSRLVEIASSGKHYDTKVDPVDLRRLILWVDTMAPYRGEEEVRALADPVFQGVDWLAIPPRIKSAPRIQRPGPVD